MSASASTSSRPPASSSTARAVATSVTGTAARRAARRRSNLGRTGSEAVISCSEATRRVSGREGRREWGVPLVRPLRVSVRRPESGQVLAPRSRRVKVRTWCVRPAAHRSISAALSSRRAASVSRCTRSRSRRRSSSWWSSNSRSLGRSGAGVSGGTGPRVGDDAAAATADDARRLAHRDADRLAGQQPALILDAHELAPLGELAEGGGHGRAARSHELGDEPVRHRHRHGNAPRARRVPSARRGTRTARGSGDRRR